MPQQTRFSLSWLHIKDLNGQDLIPKILNILPFMTTRQAVNPIFCILKIYAKNAAISPKESLMVGNDVDEDLCSAELGFDTFLITDCIINRNDKELFIIQKRKF